MQQPPQRALSAILWPRAIWIKHRFLFLFASFCVLLAVLTIWPHEADTDPIEILLKGKRILSREVFTDGPFTDREQYLIITFRSDWKSAIDQANNLAIKSPNWSVAPFTKKQPAIAFFSLTKTLDSKNVLY